MIPQAELDRALARWKARKAGREVGRDTPAPEVYAASGGPFAGAVPVEVPDGDGAAATSSGVIQLGDVDVDQDEYER